MTGTCSTWRCVDCGDRHRRPRPPGCPVTAAPPVVGVNDSADRTAKLRLWLQMTVPLEMQRLATASPAVLATLAHAASQEIAEHGDDLEFGGQFTARAVAALARALASAALTCPGGATFLGLHWCFDHSACREAERVAKLAVS